MKLGSQHGQYSSGSTLFPILAYRAMLFNLSHYQEPCCIRYRPDIKAIMRNGWSICYHLRYPDADPPPRLPVLVYQSPSNDEFKIPGTLHLPAVCELDLTAL